MQAIANKNMPYTCNHCWYGRLLNVFHCKTSVKKHFIKLKVRCIVYVVVLAILFYPFFYLSGFFEKPGNVIMFVILFAVEV